MKEIDIIRAWKDEEYRGSLSEAERAQLPEHPAGLIELSELDLDRVAGAFSSEHGFTFGCCYAGSFVITLCCAATGEIERFTYGCCWDKDNETAN